MNFDGKEIYKIYAPMNTKWTEWVRPVPFVAINTYKRIPISNWVDRKITFLTEYDKDMALFVDFPGAESIEWGIAFSKIGYRPIPIFNGTDEQIGAQHTTDTNLVESSLINGALKLKNIVLSNDSNPVFLLDSNRINRYRNNPSIFDNSWDLYGQDIPSVDYFVSNNINKILVIGNEIQKDLRKIFFKFQKKEIIFYLSDGYVTPKKVEIKKNIKEMLEKEEL